MAVHKSRVTRSKSRMKFAHKALVAPSLSIDAVTGEIHRRHHMTREGYYRGRLILQAKKITAEKAETSNE